MLSLLVLSLALAQAPAARADAAALAAQDARFAAMIRADGAALEKALDPGLTYQHSTGAAQTKSEFIASVLGGTLKYKAIDVIERTVRRIGSVFIITGVFRLQATNGAETLDTKARFTDVYECRESACVQVAWQNTRIPQ